MARSFPANFDLRLLGGPRAKQFTKPEDAFQQLMGDALKEMAGAYAHVYPTRGRDGSIDAFIIDGALLAGPFQDLPLPLIIECKTHDDAAKDVKRNILDQWMLMEGKLEAQALAGWKDLFEPWLEARAYAYCMSSHIPSEQVRQKLTSAIGTFFSSLPPDYRPPIDSVRVIDWSDLRPWLDASARISDSWLGTELELILDHETYLSRLSGFREYLLPSKLEFVPPTDESPSRPASILREIEKSGERPGVMLVGAGGVGKTRTVVEVSILAEIQGWRVLHILPDEPGVTTDDIAKTVLPYRGSRTLLVFDYLDQMRSLDLAGIKRLLGGEARKRGHELRLLATSRPAWMLLSAPDRAELFRTIWISPSESQKQKLTLAVARQIAPTACSLLGEVEVVRLCGDRAIISLLIAVDLEKQASSGLLTSLSPETFRSGDLLGWLRRRLRESSLSTVSDPNALVPKRPSAELVATAAVLACAPSSKEDLEVAAESTYDHLGRESAKDDGKTLVESLIRFGWLETRDNAISAAHDVVADEVLDQAIHTESVIFEKEFTAILSCILRIPAAFIRFASVLRRVIGALQDQSVAERIGTFQQDWLKLNVAALGDIRAINARNYFDYELDTSVVIPAGLATQDLTKEVTPKPPHDRLSLNTAYVIANLLGRTDLEYDESEEAKLIALSWLEKHNESVEAQFVLVPLLERTDLKSGEAKGAKQFALDWLNRHRNSPEDRFVLKSLLERDDLSDDETETTVRFALSWLEQHPGRLYAGFLLKALLQRGDLGDSEAKTAKQFALAWLEEHVSALEAQFVLNALLERSDLGDGEAETAKQYALAWLEEHVSALEAQFVLNPLLERGDLLGDEADATIRLALVWLELHHTTQDAGFVLHSLLEYGDIEIEEAEATRLFALNWLEQHQRSAVAAFVFPQLLIQRTSRENAQFAINSAISWLEGFYESPEAVVVLRRLFRRSDLPKETQSTLLSFAIERLRNSIRDDDAALLLRSCLQYRINDELLQRELVTLAVQWLELHPGNQDGEYVWNRILRYRPNLMPDPEWSNVVRHALHWLNNKNLSDPGVEQTTNSVLMRPHCLPVADRDVVVRLALRLLETSLHPKGRMKLVASLEYLVRSLPDHDPLKDEISRSLKNF